MFSCAYELDIEVSNLRHELNLVDCNYDDWGTDYIPISKLGPETKKFVNFFNNSFLEKVRIVSLGGNSNNSSETKWHIDNQNTAYKDEIPCHIQRPATINILLSESNDDVVYFGHDLQMNKFDIQHPGYGGITDLTIVDSFVQKEKPLLINTGVWHTVKTSSVRKMASFQFWPLISFDGAVNFCNNKGVLINR